MSLEDLSVRVPLSNEGSQFLDFVCNGGEVNGDLGDNSTELGELGVESVNSFCEVFHVLGFSGGEGVQSIDDGGPEFVELVDDLSEHALVGEVLTGGQ